MAKKGTFFCPLVIYAIIFSSRQRFFACFEYAVYFSDECTVRQKPWIGSGFIEDSSCLRFFSLKVRMSPQIIAVVLLLAVLYCDGCSSYKGSVLIDLEYVNTRLKRPKRCRYWVITYARAGYSYNVLDFVYRYKISLHSHLQFNLIGAAIGTHHIFEMDIPTFDRYSEPGWLGLTCSRQGELYGDALLYFISDTRAGSFLLPLPAEDGEVVEINGSASVKVARNTLTHLEPIINEHFEVIGIYYPVIGHIGDTSPIGGGICSPQPSRRMPPYFFYCR